MKTVSKLDEHGTYVVLHGLKELAEVLHLLGIDLLLDLTLGHDIDQMGDIVTETLADIIQGIVSVLYYVVEKRSNDRVCSQFKFVGHDLCHSNRMYDIGESGAASLLLMCFIGEFKGILNPFHVVRGKGGFE
jgi:hypothetical protein